MSISDLDPVIHAPKRFGAMAVLAGTEWVEFGFLRDHLEVKDADLSKQMAALADAGYVKTRKSKAGRGGKTWFMVTKDGRRAFDAHVAALQSVVDQAKG
ncbi:MAG: winged helix-turn-helix domain-containing protein [Acidimicrobiales bacterium]